MGGLADAFGDFISIHALREESDPLGTGSPGRQSVFQSTLSVRRATYRDRDGRDGSSNFNPRSP